MSYGFFARGVNGQMIIDDAHYVYHVLFKSSYTIEANTTNAVTITFPQAVRTQEPPHVYVSIGQGGLGSFLLTGSEGNWTGFTLRPDIVGARITYRYFVCTYTPSPSADQYGMRIYNASGQLIFDSGYTGVIFLYATRNYVRTDVQGTQFTWTTAESYAVNPNAYFFANTWLGMVPEGVGQGNTSAANFARPRATSFTYYLQIQAFSSTPDPYLVWPVIYAIPSDEL